MTQEPHIDEEDRLLEVSRQPQSFLFPHMRCHHLHSLLLDLSINLASSRLVAIVGVSSLLTPKCACRRGAERSESRSPTEWCQFAGPRVGPQIEVDCQSHSQTRDSVCTE